MTQERWPGIRSEFLFRLGEWDLRRAETGTLYVVNATRLVMLKDALERGYIEDTSLLDTMLQLLGEPPWRR